MTQEEIQAAFKAWWSESFPMAPPNSRTVETHTAFAHFVLQLAATLVEYTDDSL
jgi:hypothetical protein